MNKQQSRWKSPIHYGWIILFLAFLALLSAQGVRLSFGAFIAPWEKEFAATRSIISLIAFISFVVYGLSQPIIGKIIDRFGVRKVFSFSILIVGVMTLLTFWATATWQLMILYGIFASVGFGGASGVVASVAVTHWFKKKRGLALGMITAGTAAGQMLLVPLALWLIEGMGWKHTVLILGVLLIGVIFPVLFFLLRDFPQEKGLHAYGESEKESVETQGVEEEKANFSIWNVMVHPQFWLLAIPYFVCGFTTTGLMDTHLIPYAQFCQYTIQTTSLAVSLLAGCNIVGTLLSGYIADRFKNNYFLALLYGVRGLSVLSLLILNDPVWFLVFAIMFGLVDFATVAPTSLLATHYFQRYSVGVVLGVLYLSHQLGSSLGSYVPGLLFDWTGKYEFSFTIAAVLLGIASFLSFLLRDTAKKEATLHLRKPSPVEQVVREG